MTWSGVARQLAVFMLVLLLAGISPAPSAVAEPIDDGPPAEACPNERFEDRIGWVCDAPDGLMRIRDAPEKGLVHGLDPPPADGNLDVQAIPNIPDDPVCVNDPSEFHSRLIYTVPTDRPDRSAERADLLRDLVRAANGILLRAAQAYGEHREYRVLCQGREMTVDTVHLSTTDAATTYDSLTSDLAAAGYSERHVKYIIWNEQPSCQGGVGTIWRDTTPGYLNRNNGRHPGWGINWGCGPSWGIRTTMHEHGHNMGAVQYEGPPNASGAGHCNDGQDIMCYNDGGPTADYDPYVCNGDQRFDCNNDDYYHPHPPAENWLHDHWNVGAVYNRFLESIGDLPLTQFYEEDFDDGTADGWNIDAASWHVDDSCADAPSPPYYLGYHRVDTCNVQHVFQAGQATFSVDLSGQYDAELRFDHRWISGSSPQPGHIMRVYLDTSQTENEIAAEWDSTDPNQPDWQEMRVPLGRYLGHVTDISFSWENGRENDHDHPGWFIDNVTVYTASSIPPVARAGADQTTSDGDGDGFETFSVDGSASSDHYDNGAIVAYEWLLDETLLATGATANLTLPVGTNNVTLRVTDDDGGTAADPVVLTLLPNIAPDVSAGPDQTHDDPDGDGQATVTLAGSASDPDGTVVSYEWYEDDTFLAAGTEATVSLPVGGHEIVLVATDDGGATGNDTLFVSVAPNALPIADGSRTKNATDHDSDGVEDVHLDGTASLDADGTITNHTWRMGDTIVATGAEAVLSLPQGDHQVDLTVTDNGGASDTTTINVTVGPNLPPTADPGAGSTVTDHDDDGLADVPLDATASTDPDGHLVTYEWSKDGSVIANGATTNTTLPLGDHMITLRVTDDGGASADATHTVHVAPNAAPTAAFEPTCQGRTCTFDASASQDDGPLTYAWALGDGTSTTTGTPTFTHTYAANDRYPVCLTVTDGPGLEDTTCADALAVQAVYFADFDDGDAPGLTLSGLWRVTDWCTEPVSAPYYLGYHVRFKCSFSDGEANSGSAMFTADLDGVSDPVLHFFHRWDTGSSDRSYHRQYVQVRPADGTWTTVAYWDARDPDQLDWAPEQIDLSAWSGQTVDIRFHFATGRWWSNTYPGWHLDNIQVNTPEALYLPNQAPVAVAGPDIALTDPDGNGTEEVTLDASASHDTDGTIATYVWSHNGTTVAGTATPTLMLPVGTHDLVLEVTDDDGATDTDRVKVTVHPNTAPVAAAGPDLTGSDPDGDGNATVRLDGSASTDPDGTLVAYEWSRDGATVATGAQPQVDLPVGVHTVVLVVTDHGGATDADSVVVTIQANRAPTATGTATGGRDLDGDGMGEASLDATGSTDPDGLVVDHEWSLNGTLLATGPQANVSLPVGQNDVTLRVIDDGGLDATTTVAVEVLPNRGPLADAGADVEVRDLDGTGKENVPLDGTGSSDPDGGVLSHAWSVGGTVVATGATPVVDLAVGSHDVTLTVTDSAGLTAQDHVRVDVLPNRAPLADAGADATVRDIDGTDDETVALDGTGSSDPDGGGLSYAWSVGGTVVATGAAPDVTLAVGNHNVTLTVTDSAGLTAQDHVLVDVLSNRAPVASAGPDQAGHDADGDGNETVGVDGSASYDADGPVDHTWTLGGVLLATGVAPEISVPVGVHDVLLTVTDSGGWNATDVVQVTVHANTPPVAVAPADDQGADDDGDGNVSFTFDGSASSDPNGAIVAYDWLENDTVLASGPEVTLDLAVGTHTIELRVTDAGGLTDSDTFVVTVLANRPPFASFTAVCTDTLCSFDGAGSFDPDGDALTLTWSFGDGDTGTGPALDHMYEHAGRYTVCLTVDDGRGFSDEACKLVRVVTETYRQGFAYADTPPDWTLSGMWHVARRCGTATSGLNYLGYHNTLPALASLSSACNYQGISRTQGSASFPLDLTDATIAELVFETRWVTEQSEDPDAYDLRFLEIAPRGTQDWTVLDQWDSRDANRPDWHTRQYDLSDHVGQEWDVRFRFDSVDNANNLYAGWYLDDVRVRSDQAP